jgi:hypothetical protein
MKVQRYGMATHLNANRLQHQKIYQSIIEKEEILPKCFSVFFLKNCNVVSENEEHFAICVQTKKYSF